MDNELKRYLDEKFQSVVSKDDLARQLDKQTATLKVYTDEQTDKLAAIINETIAEPMERNFSELKDYKTVREEVSTLKSDVQKIKTALHLN